MIDPASLRQSADALDAFLYLCQGAPDTEPVREAAQRLREAAGALAAHGNRRILIHDRHGILAGLPEVRAGIRDWIDDPAPKVGGLRIRVREDQMGPHGPNSIEIRLSHDDPGTGRIWTASRIISAWELTWRAGVRDQLPARVARDLESFHRTLIDHLRHPESTPQR